MIKHVVCFKLKEGEDKEKTKNVLLSMIGNVSTAKGICVHIDELNSPRSFDIILEVILEDFKALDEYQVDPYHVGVVKKHMQAVAEKSIALDFTL